MSVYRHLTLAEREYIMVQRARGRSITAIAAALMRNKSTISREIKRNSDSKTYSASQAQACYQQRRKACRRKRKLDGTDASDQYARGFDRRVGLQTADVAEISIYGISLAGIAERRAARHAESEKADRCHAEQDKQSDPKFQYILFH